MVLRYNWIKFAVIALAIHGVVLSLPLSRNAPQALKERLIDVVVMRQEAPPAPPPAEKVEPRPAPKRVALKERAPAPSVKEQTKPLTIDEKGKVMKVDVVEATDQMFVATSVSAAKRWRFRPYKKDSVPVACRVQLGLPFRIQE